MIYLNLSDLAGIRRRQEIHAKELAADGLIKKEEDDMDEEPETWSTEGGEND